jgi:hypothetical protein
VAAEQHPVEKWVWDEADFERMGWHDCRVHAVALLEETYELCLDIDYILAWIAPAAPATHYTFWVAPATLVFENIWELTVAIDAAVPGFTLYDVVRADRQRAPNGAFDTWRWTLDGVGGRITFQASGFTQYVRRPPIRSSEQVLTHEQRHGLSFARGRDASADRE